MYPQQVLGYPSYLSLLTLSRSGEQRHPRCWCTHFFLELRGCRPGAQKHHRNLFDSTSGLFVQDHTARAEQDEDRHCSALQIPEPRTPSALRDRCPSPPPTPGKGKGSHDQHPSWFLHEKLNSPHHVVRFKVSIPFSCTWNQLH